MIISGILIHASPDKIVDVEGAVGAMEGVEVHLKTEDGRLVVTAEESSSGELGKAIMEMGRLDGVLSTSLVYQHFGDEQEDELLEEEFFKKGFLDDKFLDNKIG